ncbi:MAG: hypothetical protein ACYDB2_08355 [Acidimicrobiales bacterium]
MAKSTSGKWVSRVGAAGGGKAYQKSRPGNYYGILAVIVVLGLALTVYSRYEYQNPVKKHSTAVAPVIGSTRYAALSIESCGKKLSYLNADPTFKGGFTVAHDNVIKLTPSSAAEAGNNATLKQFAAEFPGLVATSSELAVPTSTGSTNPATTFKNGQTCSATSKYAGKKGTVVYAYWTTLAQKTPTLTTNPAKIKFVKDLRVTMAFEPTGVTPTPPSATTVDAMFAAAITPTTTTTAAVTPTTTTTVVPPTTSTTTKSATTTTSKG